MGKLDMTNPRQSIIAIQPRGIRTGDDARLHNPGFGRCGCNINNRRLVRSLKYMLLVGNKHGVSHRVVSLPVRVSPWIHGRCMGGAMDIEHAHVSRLHDMCSRVKEKLQRRGNVKKKEIKNKNLLRRPRTRVFTLTFLPSLSPISLLTSLCRDLHLDRAIFPLAWFWARS